jgi:hypothetical protein
LTFLGVLTSCGEVDTAARPEPTHEEPEAFQGPAARVAHLANRLRATLNDENTGCEVRLERAHWLCSELAEQGEAGALVLSDYLDDDCAGTLVASQLAEMGERTGAAADRIASVVRAHAALWTPVHLEALARTSGARSETLQFLLSVSDQPGRSKAWALRALGWCPQQESVLARLETELRSSSGPERAEVDWLAVDGALAGLAMLGAYAEPALPAVETLLWRVEAGKCLASMGTRRAAIAIEDGLRSSEPRSVLGSLCAVLAWKSEEELAVDAQLEALLQGHPDPEVRWNAAIASSEIAAPSVGLVGALVRCLDDESSKVRGHAAAALGGLERGFVGVIEALEYVGKHDPDPSVAETARRAAMTHGKIRRLR